MRPALYYPWVYLKGGAERVLLQLMMRSKHEWTLYTNRYEAESTFPELSDLPIRVMKQVSVRRNVVDVARAGLTLLRQSIEPAGHDSLFIVSEGIGNLMALNSRLPTSCICLTPLKVAYDERTQERYLARQRPHQVLAAKLYARIERPAWQRYVRVFCNSGETMRRLRSARLVEDGRMEVAYHGVDIERFYPTGEREPYFLVPGRITWTKNIELAIEAWKRYKPGPSDSHFRLVVSGMVDAKSRPYLRHLRSICGDRGDIDFVDSPSDSVLLEQYQRAHAVMFAAPNEDLGLVPIEAMSCGKPVLAVNRGGPLETILEGETGFLRPPDPASFAVAIDALASMRMPDLDAMAVYARARATHFTWEHFVDRIDRHADEIGRRPRILQHLVHG